MARVQATVNPLELAPADDRFGEGGCVELAVGAGSQTQRPEKRLVNLPDQRQGNSSLLTSPLRIRH